MSEVDTKQLIQWRRELHRYPEIGWAEFITTAYLIQKLRAIDMTVLVGPKILNTAFIRGRSADIVNTGIRAAKEHGIDAALLAEMQELTGCVAILDTGKPGPTLALRFDIDCVYVTETEAPEHLPNCEHFASTRPGFMHACGHDGHMAIGLGVAHWIMAHKEQLCGRIKLIFQPAEEGVRGARPIAESGIVDDVDYLLGLHLGMVAKTNEIVVNPKGFLSTTKIDFRFYGQPAHAGVEPQLGRNALAAACHCAIQIMGIPRHGSGMSQVNVGVIRAGEGRNVIPTYAEIQVEVRGATEEINNFMLAEAMRMAEGTALSFQVNYESEICGEAVELNNDAVMIDMLTDIVKQYPKLSVVEQPVGGSEDVTILAKRVQQQGGKSLYFMLGADLSAGHHQKHFDFDEHSLLTGVQLLTDCIKQLLSAKKI